MTCSLIDLSMTVLWRGKDDNNFKFGERMPRVALKSIEVGVFGPVGREREREERKMKPIKMA